VLHEPRHVPWVCALLCAHSGAAVDAARRDARGCAGPDGAAHGCASLTCSLATPLSSSRGRADTAMPNKDDAPLGAVLLCAPARERAAARPAQVPLHRRALPRLQTRHLPARADPHRYLSSTSASRLVALAQHTCAAPHCVQAELSVLPLSLDLGRLCYQSATVRAWQPLAASCKPAQTLSAHAYEFASGWVDLPHLSSQKFKLWRHAMQNGAPHATAIIRRARRLWFGAARGLSDKAAISWAAACCRARPPHGPRARLSERGRACGKQPSRSALWRSTARAARGADAALSRAAQGNQCPYAHGVYERNLHPSKYRTQLCMEGDRCARRVCFFAHSHAQLRMPVGAWSLEEAVRRAPLPRTPLLKPLKPYRATAARACRPALQAAARACLPGFRQHG
jgi:hypothetical protein